MASVCRLRLALNVSSGTVMAVACALTHSLIPLGINVLGHLLTISALLVENKCCKSTATKLTVYPLSVSDQGR